MPQITATSEECFQERRPGCPRLPTARGLHLAGSGQRDHGNAKESEVMVVAVALPPPSAAPVAPPAPGPLCCLLLPRLWHRRQRPQPETPGTPRAPHPAKEPRKSSPA
ncbi:unnamed protein product [Rangifer tarandus platyrhynchus]|uniref:Uncharacterized protein n=1 Tax=Rangifer tarandus platyrhynchus TaxID=3082113 RepID=A0AC59Z3Y9_RANTA